MPPSPVYVSYLRQKYLIDIFYRASHYSACDCPDPRHSGNCRPSDGLCECKEAFRGAEDCSACAEGYYDYPDCKPCPCFPEGTLEDENSGLPVCVFEDELGSDLQCPCRDNYSGTFCDECAPGYYNFPDCIRKLRKIL